MITRNKVNNWFVLLQTYIKNDHHLMTEEDATDMYC